MTTETVYGIRLAIYSQLSQGGQQGTISGVFL